MSRSMSVSPAPSEVLSSSSLTTCDAIMIHRRSLPERSRNGKTAASAVSATTIRIRGRSTVIQKLAVLGFLLAIVIVDLAGFRGATTMVTGFSSSSLSHQRRRCSLLKYWNDGFASTADRTTIGMQRKLGTRRIRSIIPSRTRGLGQGGRKHGSSIVVQAASSSSSTSASSKNTASDSSATGSALKRFWVRLMTGETPSSLLLRKPKWLRQSSKLYRVLPTWIFHLRPSVQLLVTIVLYLFHTTYLSQASIILPFQLFPNDRGNFQSIGLDTLAGMGTLAFYQYLRRQPTNFFDLEVKKSSRTTESVVPATNSTTVYSTNANEANATIIATTRTTTTSITASYLPDLWAAPHPKNMPWKNVWKSSYSRFSSLLSLMALTRAYFFTGRFSLFWEDKLYEMAIHWKWMTVPMHRSLSVLLGHLSWIAIGGLILQLIPRPQPFFQEPVSQWFTSSYRGNQVASAEKATSGEETLTPEQLLEYSSQQSRHPQWVWWAVGGYFVSSWFFNIADFFNSYIFPLSVLEQAEENSIVAKLVNPEGSDIWASIVGYIAPCLTAPWWEEILYRGFLLPALVLQFGTYPLALFVSGVLFSIHHQSELAFLPLCVLGWTWAIVYTKSKNLWTTILIHCMWNSRIFLGSWFGL